MTLYYQTTMVYCSKNNHGVSFTAYNDGKTCLKCIIKERFSKNDYDNCDNHSKRHPLKSFNKNIRVYIKNNEDYSYLECLYCCLDKRCYLGMSLFSGVYQGFYREEDCSNEWGHCNIHGEKTWNEICIVDNEYRRRKYCLECQKNDMKEFDKELKVIKKNSRIVNAIEEKTSRLDQRRKRLWEECTDTRYLRKITARLNKEGLGIKELCYYDIPKDLVIANKLMDDLKQKILSRKRLERLEKEKDNHDETLQKNTS